MKKKEVSKLEEALKSFPLKKREYVRILAVKLRKEGYSRKEISKITGKTISSIEDWITLFNKEGIKGLMDKPFKHEPRAKLTRKQKHGLGKVIDEKTPREMKCGDKEYWDTKSLKKLIKKKHKVVYKNDRTYQRIFTLLGYSYTRVEFEDERRRQKSVDSFKKRWQTKSGEETITMWW